MYTCVYYGKYNIFTKIYTMYIHATHQSPKLHDT